MTAAISLSWSYLWADIESGAIDPANLQADAMPRLPKTIAITVDYLRSGLPRDAYARARINRQGRRYASVHVEAWQDNRARLFAQATGHFLMPAQASEPTPDAERPNLFAKLEEASQSRSGTAKDD